MARLFKRKAELILARPNGDSFFATGPNAAVITDLRFAFTIEKSLSSDPNTCAIEISNLAEQTRTAFQTKPLKATLSAGYEDQALKQLFTGDVRWSESIPERLGWLTKLEMGDGHRAFRFARISKSFKAGASPDQVLSEIAGSMGLKVPESASEAVSLAKSFANGVSVSGPSHSEMTKILETRGFGWSVQDGALQVLRDSDVRPGEALVVSVDTGLIGSPSYGSPPQKGKPPVLKLETLLYPEMSPGIKIQIDSRTIKGLFKVLRVQHTGDTHGKDWTTAIEARAL